MRNVVTGWEVCHKWANQTQSSARNPQGNVYFHGGTICSYGGHFPMARHVNKNTILFTTRTYSNTTAKHLSYVRQAIHGLDKTVIHCYDPSAIGINSHAQNINSLAWEALDFLDKSTRSRKYRESLQGQGLGKVQDIHRYMKLFKISKKSVFEQLDVKQCLKIRNALKLEKIDMEEYKEIRKKHRKQLACAEKKAQEKKDKAFRLVVEEWKQGQHNAYLGRVDNLTLLRVKGDVVETSLGVKITKAEASVIYQRIQRNKPLHGFEIQGYKVVGLVDGVLTVGCHKIMIEEIHNAAKELGID